MNLLSSFRWIWQLDRVYIYVWYSIWRNNAESIGLHVAYKSTILWYTHTHTVPTPLFSTSHSHQQWTHVHGMHLLNFIRHTTCDYNILNMGSLCLYGLLFMTVIRRYNISITIIYWIKYRFWVKMLMFLSFSPSYLCLLALKSFFYCSHCSFFNVFLFFYSHFDLFLSTEIEWQKDCFISCILIQKSQL